MSFRSQGLHSLPSETLTEVLLLDVDAVRDPARDSDESMSFRRYYSRLYELSRVCKYWQAILEGSSLFWAKVSSDFPALITGQLFRQSRSSPLDIMYQFHNRNDTWLSTQLALHFSRVRTLTLAAADALHPTVHLKDFVGASLEKLYIHDYYRGLQSHLRQATFVLAAELPQLRRLIHRGASVTLNWPTISNLTHLEITRCFFQTLGTDGYPLSVLRNNPMLVSVKLQHLLDGTGSMDASAPPRPIHLNHLTTLHLTHNSNALTFGVLSAIVSPVYSDVEVDLPRAESAGAPLQSIWSENLNSFASTVLLQPHTHISIDVSIWSWREPELNMDLDGRRVLHVRLGQARSRGERVSRLPELVDYFCQETASVVEVSLTSHQRMNGWKRVLKNDEHDMWELLASVPNVTRLDLQVENTKKIVELLMRTSPAFPKLKRIRLELTKWTPKDFMVPVLRYRNTIPTVASLEELEITSGGEVWYEPPAQLMALLGDAALTWLPMGDPGDRRVFKLPSSPYTAVHRRRKRI